MFGFIFINKPLKMTSHDVVDRLRKITKIKKIGHAGTLDPLARGVLIVAIGREATRDINKFVKMNKEYEADLHLGENTDTYDSEGDVVSSCTIMPSEEDVKKTLKKFVGEQKQLPPMFSAKKVNGQRLYKLARAGVEVERVSSNIKIHNIDFLSYDWPILKIQVKCSSGTYIRSLAFDIGQRLGCGAHLAGLVRTKVGEISLSDCVELGKLDEKNWGEYLVLL
ncbi:MAG: tRNA pseudouridine(55) synthase TruB [bacterium]